MDQDTNTPEVTAAPVTPETPATPAAAPVTTTPASTAHQVSTGIIVGTLVFATILIVATYVALSDVRTPIQRGLPSQLPVQLPATSTVDTDPAAAALSVQGTSDEVVDIEADLNATDFNSLDEIDQI